MPYRLDRMIVVAGVTMVIGVAPAFAHGGGSHGHGRSSASAARIGAFARSFGPASTLVSPGARSITSPAPLAKMLVTTALGAPAMTTKGPTTSAVADPPAADPPAPGAAVAGTSPSTMSGGVGGGSPTDLSQFNPGAQDLATSAVSAPTTTNITDLAIPAASGLLTTDLTTTTLFTTGSQVTTGSADPRRQWRARAERRHQRCGGTGAHHRCDKQRCDNRDPRRGHCNQRRIFPNRWWCYRQNHAGVHGGLGQGHTHHEDALAAAVC